MSEMMGAERVAVEKARRKKKKQEAAAATASKLVPGDARLHDEKEEEEDTAQLSTPQLSTPRRTVLSTPRKECVYRCWTRSATSKIDPAMAALARAYPFVCDKYVVEDSYVIWPRDGMISRPDIHQLKPGQEIYCLYTNTRIASPSTSQVPL